jgi:hypothetical protein
MVDKLLSNRQLDDAIDRAVRDLMSAEPPPDLRARVLAVVEGAPARLTLWPRLALGGAVLSVIAVLVATLVFRPVERAETGRVAGTLPAPTSSADTGSPPSPPRAERTRPSSQRDDVRPAPPPDILAQGRQRVADNDRLVQAASIDTGGRTVAGGDALDPAAAAPVDLLGPVETIRIPTLSTPATTTPALVIDAIGVTPIDIAPLTPRR